MQESMTSWVSVLPLALVFFAGVSPSLFEILFGFGCGSLRENGGMYLPSHLSQLVPSLAPSSMVVNGMGDACVLLSVVLRFPCSPFVVTEYHLFCICMSLLYD